MASPRKSDSLDPLPISFLKSLIGLIAPILSETINASLREDYVTNVLKTALLTCLYHVYMYVAVKT